MYHWYLSEFMRPKLNIFGTEQEINPAHKLKFSDNITGRFKNDT